jgi:hypothetical protein
VLGDRDLGRAVVRGAAFLAREAWNPTEGRYARTLRMPLEGDSVERDGAIRGPAGMLLALGFVRGHRLGGGRGLLDEAERAATLALDDVLESEDVPAPGRDLSILLRAAPVVLAALEGG